MKNEITFKKIYFILLLLLYVFNFPVRITAQFKVLENSIDSLLKSGDITAFSSLILKGDDIVWSMTRGMADIENRIPVTANTVFMMASASKTMTGAALMHLYDKGAFNLDDDINNYLPFKIRNPNYPDVPITIRMLLTHTSSLTDVQSYISKLYGSGDQRTVSFGEIIKNSYDLKGEYYKPENFLKSKPGELWSYCNSNFVLIAYLVELLSKQSFAEYTKENFFKPLEMNETGWFYSDFDTTHIAVNYVQDNSNANKKERVVHYSWPGYSDGCLHSSPTQYANFLKMYYNNGSFKGKQILKPETVAKILTLQNVKGSPTRRIPPITDYGLGWMVAKDDYSNQYFFHGGAGTGIMTLVFMKPDEKMGFIIFLTGDYNKLPEWYDSKLFKIFTRQLNNMFKK